MKTLNKIFSGLRRTRLRGESITAGNGTYKKLAVQWLNETLCFVSSLSRPEKSLQFN